jgi:hypothetical protein
MSSKQRHSSNPILDTSGSTAPVEISKPAVTFPYFPTFGLRTSHSERERGREREPIPMIPSSLPERGQDNLSITSPQNLLLPYASSGFHNTASTSFSHATVGESHVSLSASSARPYFAELLSTPPAIYNVFNFGGSSDLTEPNDAVSTTLDSDSTRQTNGFRVTMLHHNREFDSEKR